MSRAEESGWVTPPRDTWPVAVRALTTTRQGPGERQIAGLGGWNLADHVEDSPPIVAANRRELVALTGVRGIQWLRQVHGTVCFEATTATALGVPEADAAWTAEPGLALAVLTADCVPVVVAHRRSAVVGVAHGGWRGLVGGVLGNLVQSMPVAAAELVAWLGPAIGPAVYEIGEDVSAAVADLPDGERLAARSLRAGTRGRPHLDLFTLAGDLLEVCGVGEVVTDRLCTYTDRRFFSYRRDGRTGRMVTLGWLADR